MTGVRGATDRVVVIGAGLGGLSAALRLAAAGRQVTVVERAPVPGGRAGQLQLAGYTFDTGPSVLTMPHVIAEAFACVGERLDGWVELQRLDPAYRALFPDGSRLDVRADPDATATEIEQVCGAGEATGYRRFVDYASRLYRLEMSSFIDHNLDSPLRLLTPDLARLAALGAFRRLDTKVGQFFRDPRTRRMFSFQALYAGLSPYDARALYAVIAYMDTIGGVFFPRGGMHAIPDAMARVAARHGVGFRYNTEAIRIELHGERAAAVLTSAGERIPADVVVVNADPPVAYRTLLPELAPPRRLRRARYSPSCFLLMAGSRQGYAEIAHHTVSFGRAWRRTFTELIDWREPMSDPSFLVSNPTRTDPTLAPDGRQVYHVVFPAPNVDGRINWDRQAPRYYDEVVAWLQRRGWVGFADAVEVRRWTTPADWQRLGHERGTPFAAAHTMRQTGPWRAANLAPGLDNVVFAGSGTQPGVGVPMVIISGRLAAERITGRLR
jgi:phytoene desaturase